MKDDLYVWHKQLTNPYNAPEVRENAIQNVVRELPRLISLERIAAERAREVAAAESRANLLAEKLRVATEALEECSTQHCPSRPETCLGRTLKMVIEIARTAFADLAKKGGE